MGLVSLLLVLHTALLTLAGGLIYTYIIFPLYVSPLSKVPTAHWSCSISPLWMLWRRVSARQNRTVYEAHQRHGDVVRLGPNELSVNCLEDGVHTIYGPGFEKNEYYSYFDSFHAHCMFSTPDSLGHRVRRKMISQLFSKSSVQNSHSFIVQARRLLHNRLLPLLERATLQSSNEGIDVYGLWQGYAMDTISAYYLGMANSTNFIENAKEREMFRANFLVRTPYAVYIHELPWLMQCFSTLRLHVIPRAYARASRVLESIVRQWYVKTTEFIISNPNPLPEDEGNEPLVLRAILSGYEQQSHLVSSQLGEIALKQPERHIMAELMDNLTAGYDTTGIVMTYISWRLSRALDVQDELRKELQSLEKPLYISNDDAYQAVPEAKVLDALPLLHAIVMETLRLHCPVPGGQPRVVSKTGVKIGNYPNIPCGTRVAASAYVLHRNAKLFPEPETWRPERWLHQDQETLKEMEKWFWAFSSGGRMCAGRNFAIAELKLLTAAVYTNFQTKIKRDDNIEQMDGHTVGPKAGSLWLKISRPAVGTDVKSDGELWATNQLASRPERSTTR